MECDLGAERIIVYPGKRAPSKRSVANERSVLCACSWALSISVRLGRAKGEKQQAASVRIHLCSTRFEKP